MNNFFFLIEVFILLFAAYIFVAKKELAIVYIPVIIFSRIIATPMLPLSIYYGIVSFLVLYLIYRNSNFLKENPYSLVLIILYFILLTNSTNIEAVRSGFFPVIWMFLLIPLISAVYRKYTREEILQELTSSGLVILIVFIANVLASSYYGYSPKLMYGISSGVQYGNLYATDFNILAIAVFVVLLRLINKKNLVYFAVFIISLSFIMLSFRRSVMGLSMLGIGIILLMFMANKNIMNFLVFGGIMAMVGFVIILNTSFVDVFIERYEQRNLDERELGEETRFMEYEIIYDDLFVYQDYNPWFGYEILNSGGNYGKGILESRTLHSDLTNIVHSTGIVGLVLYLLMMAQGFWLAYRHSKDRSDKLILLFCLAAFAVYTITGRYTSVESIIFIFLLLMLPVTRHTEEEQPAPELAYTSAGSGLKLKV